MTQTYKLTDANHDLTVNSSGKLVRVFSNDEIRQRILVALLHEWEEYFLNVPSGLPWYDYILGAKDPSVVELLIRQAILAVPGVVSIQNLTLRKELRRLYIQADVEANYQIITVSTVVG